MNSNQTTVTSTLLTTTNKSADFCEQLNKDLYTKQKNDLGSRIVEPILLILLSFAIFRATQYICRWYLFGKWKFRTFNFYKFVRRRRSTNKSVPDITAIDVVPPNKKWRISNTMVSLIHSAISGLWALYILLKSFDKFFYNASDEFGKGLTCVYEPIGYYLIYTTFGYLVHDFVDLVINEQSSRITELLFHHVIVILAFMVTLIDGKFMGVVIIGLLMEVNSIFLHTRSLLNLYGIPKTSTAFKFVALLNIFTYMAFRIFVSIYLLFWWASSITLHHYIAWYLYVINALLLVSLSATNGILFYRVLSADGILGKRRARQYGNRQSSAHSAHGENGGIEPVIEETNEEEEDDNYSSDDENSDQERSVRKPSNPALTTPNCNETTPAIETPAATNGTVVVVAPVN